MDTTSKTSPNYLRDYLILFGAGGFIILLDQVTKILVRSNLGLGEWWTPWVWSEPYFRIVNWKNTGAAFGILPHLGDYIAILAVVVGIAIMYYFPRIPREDWTLKLAMVLTFGGALGNLIDRLTIGWVTDYVSIWRFPVFNVADLCITLGVIVLLLGVWSQERSKETTLLEGEQLTTDNNSEQTSQENVSE